MRSLSKRLTMGLASLLLGGCLSSGAGYDLARSTVADRTDLEVPASEDADATRAQLLKKPLTADSAARLALVNSANLQVVLANVGVSRAQLLAALRLPNPHAEAGVHFHDGEMDVELTGTIDIVPLLMLPAREAAASQLLDASSLEAAGALLDLAFGAKIAFYEYQAAAQILELRKTVTYAAAQSAEIAARLLQAGNIPELDALNERALYEETRLALAKAEAAEVVARERLNAVLGLTGQQGAGWTVDSRLGDPDGFDPGELEAKALDKNLEIAAYRKRYGAASVQADLAWAEGFLPSLEVGASAEREDGHWSRSSRWPKTALSSTEPRSCRFGRRSWTRPSANTTRWTSGRSSSCRRSGTTSRRRAPTSKCSATTGWPAPKRR
jgi:outer membrane protein TolC